jgi:signal transduction histidine kinase
LGNDARLSELATAYERAFNAYRAIDRRIGTTENTGLQWEMRAAAHAAESDALELANIATAAEISVQRKQAPYSIAILVLGTIAGAFAFYRVAQSIVRPLTELRDVAISLGHHEMDTRVEIKANNEVGDMAVAFNRLLDRLQEAFEHERRFSDNAAHQLRTPLTIIQGEIDVTLRQSRSPLEYESCLSKVSRVNQEMSHIVESLLFLSRAPKHTPVADSKCLELAEWIAEFTRRFEYDERVSDFSTRVQGTPSVVVSPLLLSQLLDNLIRNAFRYSVPGSPVHLEVSTVEADVEFSVRDEGIGVPADERESIFEPFYRSSVSQKSGISGTGLGLSIARRIAELFGGRIECRNRDDCGSTFVLVLRESSSAKEVHA